MIRSLLFVLPLLGMLLSGCIGRGPVGRERAEALSAWIESHPFSTRETYRQADANPPTPASPDGLTLGSPHVFAALGTDPDDLSGLDGLWCDRRATRPLARPLTTSVLLEGPGLAAEESDTPIPLGDFPEQRLRRIRRTSIAISDAERGDVSVRCVNFAPSNPDLNFLARWFVVENTGTEARRVRLQSKVMAPGEWVELDGGGYRRGDRFAILSDAPVSAEPDAFSLSLGRLKPGQRAAAALLLVGAADEPTLHEHVARARQVLPDLLPVLEETRSEWEAWCTAIPLETGDAEMDDLLDSLLCLVRSHVGMDAVHTGSLRYPHDRAWVRDSYWVQRALLELGRTREAQLNLEFFHRAWRASGIASYYEIADLSSTAYGYHGVELPHYLVLMVRDAEQIAGLDGAPYWDMVQACMDAAAVPENGLQPMNGDETWLLAAPVRELDDLLDNSWLLIASAEYASTLAARVGDAERAATYRGIAARARAALGNFVPRFGQAEWHAVGHGADGSLDLSLCPGVIARGAVLGVVPATEPLVASGLTSAWNRLGYDRGIRTHARSATICGGTPGYVLHAAAECPSATFTAELSRRLLRFASATGCVWEFHDTDDPSWGGEKRRLWDSAVVLMGLVHALFEKDTADGQTRFLPRSLPQTEARSPAPAFDARALLADGQLESVLQSGSPRHAERVARAITRHWNRRFGIAPYAGAPPSDRPAIILSRSGPPTGWKQTPRGYWIRPWEGPPQIWVRNKGHVYLDTDPFLTDLFSYVPPRREKPLPFPDANFDLAARLGERGRGEAELSLSVLGRADRGRASLGGGRATLNAGEVEVSVVTEPREAQRLLKLRVSAPGPRSAPAELLVTLPAGWWLVYARDMSGNWDRIRHPVGQIRLADGRIRLVYSIAAGDAPLNLSFDLTRLGLGPT